MMLRVFPYDCFDEKELKESLGKPCVITEIMHDLESHEFRIIIKNIDA
jgi:hypothetical protein